MNVWVAGSPRSGTSFVTRALILSGLDAGTRALQAAQEAKERNEEQRWEDPGFLTTNKHVFRANDCEFLWANALLIGTLKQGTVEAVLNDKREPWVIKDPSLSMTFPFWDQNIPGGHLVACLRHPAAAIASIQEVFGVGYHRAATAWFRDYKDLLTWTQLYPGRVHWVSFPDRVGMRSAWESLGLPCTSLSDSDFQPSQVHFTPQPMAPEYGVLEDLYSLARSKCVDS